MVSRSIWERRQQALSDWPELPEPWLRLLPDASPTATARRSSPAWVRLVAVSFAAMALAPLMAPDAQLCLLVVSAIGFDLGIQASLVAHQTIVYGIDASARSRLNALLFTVMFIGMAIGSALAAWLFAQFGWMAVTALATATALAALALRLKR